MSFEITRKWAHSGEVARADIIKARLQFPQRECDLLHAQAAVLRGKIALGAMLFSDPSQTFAITEDLTPDLSPAPLTKLNLPVRANTANNRAAGNPNLIKI